VQERILLLKKEEEEGEQKECTFRPAINPVSHRMAARPATPQAGLSSPNSNF